MQWEKVIVEGIGWLSTLLFLVSIITPARLNLHILGVLSSLTTGFYAFCHDATAIWVKWIIALFFHLYMIRKILKMAKTINILILIWFSSIENS